MSAAFSTSRAASPGSEVDFEKRSSVAVASRANLPNTVRSTPNYPACMTLKYGLRSAVKVQKCTFVPHLLPLLSPEIWTPRQQTRRKPGTTQHGEGPGRGASQAIPNSGKHSGLGSTRHLSH